LHHQDILTPKEKFEHIKKVRAVDIQRVFKQIAKEDRLNLAIVGPFKDGKKFRGLLKM
jgi:predicted Zn-dependent peptidase